jgi:hypothetical protein
MVARQCGVCHKYFCPLRIHMRLTSDDIARLIRACECYKDRTGSEHMWDEYNALQNKLKIYADQHAPAEGN